VQGLAEDGDHMLTRDDIIRMAREAGFSDKQSEVYFDRMLQRFTTLVAAAEREACARLVERDDSMRWSGAADAIRARGNK
jgi:hypothetical protein